MRARRREESLLKRACSPWLQATHPRAVYTKQNFLRQSIEGIDAAGTAAGTRAALMASTAAAACTARILKPAADLFLQGSSNPRQTCFRNVFQRAAALAAIPHGEVVVAAGAADPIARKHCHVPSIKSVRRCKLMTAEAIRSGGKVVASAHWAEPVSGPKWSRSARGGHFQQPLRSQALRGQQRFRRHARSTTVADRWAAFGSLTSTVQLQATSSGIGQDAARIRSSSELCAASSNRCSPYFPPCPSPCSSPQPPSAFRA
eukprot:TRINITY_DN4968_c0_g1_i2.p1 TRINITY_DN4968_c0_g1~~TRINITY_DN4968_c0_g1_i2.p1  ORF type:complete len:260 (-),score=28.75 TRINITY_DN4968_c0_g1_i2:7-786(-)